MRVAVFGIKALPAFAGADRVVERLLEHASPEIDYTVYLVRGAPKKLECTGNLHYVYVPALRGKHLRAASYFLLCCLHYLVKGARYDAVHVHNSDFGLVSPLLRLRRGVRIVGTFHGDPYKRGKWGGPAKAILRASEWVFVRTCDELTSVSAEKRSPRHVVRHIPNGLDDRAVAAADESTPALASDGYVMFACGRLDRTKGLHHLLRAYADMPTSAQLLVVGDFSHDARYAAEIEHAAAADDRVIVHRELLEPAALFAAVRRSTVFVFPSEVEGMSMMLLEAITCGALVVCSDIPENIAVVGSDHRYFFRSGDPASLRVTLEAALAGASTRDPKLLIAQMTDRFSWGNIAAEYEDLYTACATSDNDARLQWGAPSIDS